MHGLNTHVTTDYTTPIDQPTSTVAANMEATRDVYDPCNPDNMSTFIPTFASSGDTQFYLKRYYQIITLNNCGSYPVNVEISRYRARKDQVQTFLAVMDKDVVGAGTFAAMSTMQYTPVGLGNEFRRNWKLISHKHKVIQPMRPIRFKASPNYSYLKKPITYDTEGSIGYAHRRGNIVTFVRTYGVPCPWSLSNATGFTPYFVYGVRTTYASWYRLDDVTPTSSVSNNIGATNTLISFNNAYLPTYVGMTPALQPSTRTIGPSYVKQSSVPEVPYI